MATGSQRKHQNNKEQVLEWIKEFQETEDEEIQTKLVLEFESLVHALARKFSKGQRHDEDLIQVGMIGLLAAFRRFDPSFGRSFESFAVPTIVGESKGLSGIKHGVFMSPGELRNLALR